MNANTSKLAPCCKDWGLYALSDGRDQIIDPDPDGTWNVSGCSQCYVLTGVQFCPWCGASVVRPPKKATPI